MEKNYELVSENYEVFEPAFSCGLAGGFLASLGFDGGSFLVHGSSGCAFGMRYGLAQHWKSFIPCPVTGLHERDVIFGGTNLLRKGIERIEKIHESDILFILTSCSAEIIGDDLEEIALETSEKYNKKVIVIEVGGATGKLIDGYNEFLYKVIKDFQEKYLEDSEEEAIDTDSHEQKYIDIIGIIPLYDMFFRGNMTELKRLVEKMGVRVNSFFCGECNVETTQNMMHSDLAVSLSNNIGKKALSRLKKFSGVRTKHFQVAPIGYKYTKLLLRSIAETLELDMEMLERMLEEEEAEARKKMLRGFDFSKVMFTSARVAIIGETSLVLGLANFLLNELGIRSAMFAFLNEVTDEEMEELNLILNGRNNHAKVLVEQDNYLIRKTLLETRPNLIFGRSIDRLAELENAVHITWQFPATNRLVVYDKPYFGFNGVVSIVDDIINGFSNIWY